MEIGQAMQWINEFLKDEPEASKAVILTMLMDGELTICPVCFTLIDIDEDCTACAERTNREAEIAAERAWDQHDLRDTRY